MGTSVALGEAAVVGVAVLAGWADEVGAAGALADPEAAVDAALDAAGLDAAGLDAAPDDEPELQADSASPRPSTEMPAILVVRMKWPQMIVVPLAAAMDTVMDHVMDAVMDQP